ncbi:MAG: flagellar biosynthesis protein FlhB [Arcobacteraceae bacterium]|nr:flagellar biosynthesis protein FlhB [Arcobacteraceae bacterium]
MADADKDSKTEEATSKKIEDSKAEGNVPKSAEVPGAAILFFSSIYLLFFAGDIFENIQKMMLYVFSFIGEDIDGTVLFTITYTVINTLLYSLTPLFIMVVFLAVIFNVMQFGFILTPLKLELSKINPFTGFSNVFSLKKGLEALKLTAKLTIIFIVMVIILVIVWDDILVMMDMTIHGSISLIINLIGYFLVAILLIVIIFAIIDFFFTRHYYFEQLKMTKQEIKDEHKQMDGDPLVKGRIRSIQMKMSRQRMMKDVADADVVITNPTHYAVALQYKQGEQNAPKMVGKGIDFLAIKMKDVARENNIPIIENPAMARALYDQLDIEQEVPEEFYKAIAEIFTYIYELNK